MNYVICDTDGADLVFRVVSDAYGISPLYRLEGCCDWLGRNPRAIYSEQGRLWCGKEDWDDSRLVVATVQSGALVPYEGEG